MGYLADNSIEKTTDGGLNWINFNSPGIIVSLYFLNTDTGFGVGSGAFKTVNGGLNWISVSTDSFPDYSVKFVNANIGFYDTRGIKKTSNGGDNWQYLPTGVNGQFVSLSFVNENIGFALIKTSFVNNLIIKTIDGGNNWNTVYNGTYLNSIFFTNNDTGYAVGGDQNIYNKIIKTSNSGLNWFELNTGSNYQSNSVFFINDNTGYTCGQDGIILKTTSGGEPIGIKPVSNSIPSKFILFQNFPNPFNPKTVIKYNLPISCFVRLMVYDILGRKVSELVNETQTEGIYKIKWDASNYASGVYFYRIEARDFVAVKKMVLIK